MNLSNTASRPGTSLISAFSRVCSIFLLSLLNVALNKSDVACATLCVVVWVSLFSSLIFKRYLPVKLVSGSSEWV